MIHSKVTNRMFVSLERIQRMNIRNTNAGLYPHLLQTPCHTRHPLDIAPTHLLARCSIDSQHAGKRNRRNFPDAKRLQRKTFIQLMEEKSVLFVNPLTFCSVVDRNDEQWMALLHRGSIQIVVCANIPRTANYPSWDLCLESVPSFGAQITIHTKPIAKERIISVYEVE